MLKRTETESRLTQGERSLADFASGHEYFGLHLQNNEWIFREWAPNAARIYLIGDMTNWREKKDFALHRISQEGHWEIRLSQDKLKHGDHYRLRIHWLGGQGDRIPAYARRVVQDPDTMIFNAQVWSPPNPYRWKCMDFQPPSDPIFVYEVHVGMAQEEEKIGSCLLYTSDAADEYNPV